MRIAETPEKDETLLTFPQTEESIANFIILKFRIRVIEALASFEEKQRVTTDHSSVVLDEREFQFITNELNASFPNLALRISPDIRQAIEVVYIQDEDCEDVFELLDVAEDRLLELNTTADSGSSREAPVELDQERGAFVYCEQQLPWVDSDGRVPPVTQLQGWMKKVNAKSA